MLYALLVEGQGLLGSTFNADDFSDREVQDTDGDGLPEFVDAWGKPLQFFRWPCLYHSDAQRGQNYGTDADSAGTMMLLPPYASVFESREQNPLDPGQTLMAPAWWLASQNAYYPLGTPLAGATGASGGVGAFEMYFHRLTEPMQFVAPPTGGSNRYWDRGGYAGLNYRRAFFTKPLILSGGPDQQPGVGLFTAPTVGDVIDVENNAVQFWPSEMVGPDKVIPADGFDLSTRPNTFQLIDAGQDDITNHNVTSAAGSGG
jgi:hypothetical protein